MSSHGTLSWDDGQIEKRHRNIPSSAHNHPPGGIGGQCWWRRRRRRRYHRAWALALARSHANAKLSKIHRPRRRRRRRHKSYYILKPKRESSARAEPMGGRGSERMGGERETEEGYGTMDQNSTLGRKGGIGEGKGRGTIFHSPKRQIC